MQTSLGGAAGDTVDHAAGNGTGSFGGSRSFRLNEFEGPLDLLLFLIKKNEINIYDIPIAQITEQYLDYLASVSELDMEEISEFHAMAATLLLIKSRMLLPVEMEEDDEDEDPRQELVERLIEYQKYKKLSLLMQEKEREAEWVIERKRLQRPLPFDDEGLWEQVDVWDLLKIFSEFTSGLSRERIIDLYEEVTVNEKIALLFEILEEKGECLLTNLIIRNGSILDFVCAFLAILEVVKQHMVVVLQNRMFGDIIIRPNGKVFYDGIGNNSSGSGRDSAG
ncbi:MAG: segregation/condensation protein A [Treponema sp.]|nr:segregation/condensation protein A [Treponema sp.]